jgi:hypothetical protein
MVLSKKHSKYGTKAVIKPKVAEVNEDYRIMRKAEVAIKLNWDERTAILF